MRRPAPRMLVRVFGGFGFSKADLQRSDFAENGYQKGVPMGGDLTGAPAGKAPGFLVRAMRDPDGANLDRVQVIKGWVDAAGKTHEKVYDIAWSGARKPDPKTGELPPVGNTVNVGEATYSNAIGAPFLEAFWNDPAFDSAERAFYYVRDARDSDAAMDDLRRKGVRSKAADRRAGQHPGARVHDADLVHPVTALAPGEQRRVLPRFHEYPAPMIRLSCNPTPRRTFGSWCVAVLLTAIRAPRTAAFRDTTGCSGSSFPVDRLLWRPGLDRCAAPRGSGHSSMRSVGQ